METKRILSQIDIDTDLQHDANPPVSQRFLQCTVERYCVKNDSGNRILSLRNCLDCKYSLISERPYATLPTKKVNYHKNKDNHSEELKHRD